MLKISTIENQRTITLVFEGSLGGDWVSEAVRVWDRVLQSAQQRAVIVDLCAVTYVTASGRELLSAMHRAGAQVLGSGTLIGSLIQEIIHESGCSR
jgi:hypothetical protein